MRLYFLSTCWRFWVVRYWCCGMARSRDRGGAGLGLPLAGRIVARHGGTLELDDSELGGARFEVRLPLAQPEPE